MLFSVYLKKCRENYNFTQEELVHTLYSYHDIFYGLDVGTLSRWERNTTKPNIEKQIQILKFFQTQSGVILSCFDESDQQEIEEKLCKIGVKNLLGSSKEHILNGPTTHFKMEFTSIKEIPNADDIDRALAMPYSTILNLTNNAYKISLATLKEWSLNPSNLFLYAEYHEQFAGMFFSLRLKPTIFHQLLSFELLLKDITVDDFASFDEIGCDLPIAFFAHNEKISTLLMVRNFSHLIAHQRTIEEVGTMPLLDGAKKLVQNINLRPYKSKKVKEGKLESYVATLADILINESVIKMLFQKQQCPEDTM